MIAVATEPTVQVSAAKFKAMQKIVALVQEIRRNEADRKMADHQSRGGCDIQIGRATFELDRAVRQYEAIKE